MNISSYICTNFIEICAAATGQTLFSVIYHSIMIKTSNDISTKSFITDIRIISIIYFVFLIAVVCIFGYTPNNDTEGYIEYAKICLHNNQPYPCTSTIVGQPFIWNIGIINLVETSIYLFGSIIPILPLMCLMKAITAFLTGKIAEILFNRKVGLTATLLFVLYPGNWGQSTFILSEIPMTCFALLSLYLLLKSNRRYLFFIAGFTLCLANWFRGIALIFILAIIIYHLIFDRNNLLKKIIPFIAGYLTFIIIAGSSTYIRTGYFIYQGDTLWFNICDDAYDGASIAPHYGQDPYEKGKPRYIEDMRTKTCFECADIWKSRCLPWIMNHKIEWIKKIPYRLWYIYSSDHDNISAFLHDKSKPENNVMTLPIKHIFKEYKTLSSTQWLALANALIYYSLILCFVLSLIMTCIRRNWKQAFLPLFIVIVGSLLLALVIHGETRFKLPFLPFIFIMAAYFVSNLFSAQRQPRALR